MRQAERSARRGVQWTLVVLVLLMTTSQLLQCALAGFTSQQPLAVLSYDLPTRADRVFFYEGNLYVVVGATNSVDSEIRISLQRFSPPFRSLNASLSLQSALTLIECPSTRCFVRCESVQLLEDVGLAQLMVARTLLLNATVQWSVVSVDLASMQIVSRYDGTTPRTTSPGQWLAYDSSLAYVVSEDSSSTRQVVHAFALPAANDSYELEGVPLMSQLSQVSPGGGVGNPELELVYTCATVNDADALFVPMLVALAVFDNFAVVQHLNVSSCLHTCYVPQRTLLLMARTHFNGSMPIATRLIAVDGAEQFPANEQAALYVDLPALGTTEGIACDVNFAFVRIRTRNSRAQWLQVRLEDLTLVGQLALDQFSFVSYFNPLLEYSVDSRSELVAAVASRVDSVLEKDVLIVRFDNGQQQPLPTPAPAPTMASNTSDTPAPAPQVPLEVSSGPSWQHLVLLVAGVAAVSLLLLALAVALVVYLVRRWYRARYGVRVPTSSTLDKEELVYADELAGNHDDD